MRNQYADHNVKCFECTECEAYPMGGMATCRSLLDGIYDRLGIQVAELKIDPTQDAGRCECFDPTNECLARISEESRPLYEQYGLGGTSGLVRRVA